MSLETPPTIEELQGNPERVAAMQKSLGEQWAKIYANPAEQIPNARAEVTLRNPSIYPGDVDCAQLPNDLRNSWSTVLSVAQDIAIRADTAEHQWSPATNGLENVQLLVSRSEVDPQFRGEVAAMMNTASMLFVESTKHIPGSTRYYAENVVRAASWLPKGL